MLSVSHQVWASGVPQTDTDSNSVTVLCLRPLSKTPKVPECQRPPAECPQLLVVGWESSESGQERLPGSSRPGFVCAKAGLCTSQVCKERKAPAIALHNSVCLDSAQTPQEPVLSRARALGVGVRALENPPWGTAPGRFVRNMGN